MKYPGSGGCWNSKLRSPLPCLWGRSEEEASLNQKIILGNFLFNSSQAIKLKQKHIILNLVFQSFTHSLMCYKETCIILMRFGRRTPPIESDFPYKKSLSISEVICRVFSFLAICKEIPIRKMHQISRLV